MSNAAPIDFRPLAPVRGTVSLCPMRAASRHAGNQPSSGRCSLDPHHQVCPHPHHRVWLVGVEALRRTGCAHGFVLPMGGRETVRRSRYGQTGADRDERPETHQDAAAGPRLRHPDGGGAPWQRRLALSALSHRRLSAPCPRRGELVNCSHATASRKGRTSPERRPCLRPLPANALDHGAAATRARWLHDPCGCR